MRVGPGVAAVRNGDGSILVGTPSASGRTLVVPVKEPLAKGDYTVRWSIISDDGHNERGVVAFAVGGGTAIPALSAGGDAARWLALVGRFLWLGGILVAAGAGLFRLLVSRERKRPFLLGVQGGATASLAGGGLILLARPDALHTRFGTALLVALGLSAVVAFGAALAPHGARALDGLALGAAALVLIPATSGHALDPGRPHWASVLVDLVHSACAAFWVGGLVQVALAPSRPALTRWSRLALPAVVLLAAAGAGNAVLELSSPSQLWTTSYGRALVAKSVLFVMLVLVASLSRRLVGTDRLRPSVVVELGLLVPVVIATAFLTDSRPGLRVAKPIEGGGLLAPPSLPKPPLGALALAGRDHGTAVTLAVQADGRRLTLTGGLIANDGSGLSGQRYQFRVLGAPGDSAFAEGAPCGDGCYRAVVDGPASPREIVAYVNGDPVRFTMPRPWPPEPRPDLARRATDVFTHLSALRWYEVLDNGAGAVVRTHWHVQAPDRFEYLIADGIQSIQISRRRWTRTPPSGPWQLVFTDPVVQPEPYWGEAPTNSYLLRRETVDGRPALRIALVARSIPAWFEIDVDAATFLPLRLRMTAGAHFMHHVYSGWNQGPPITPPGR